MKKLVGMIVACFIAGGPLSAKECTNKEMAKMSLCSVNRYPDCGYGWYADVGMLVEQMRISNSQACVILDFNTIAPVTIAENVPLLNFEVDLGLRLALGYNTMFDNWDLKAAFEWQNSRASYVKDISNITSSAATPYGVALLSDEEGNAILFNNINASLTVRYFLLDIMLSKGSYFSKCFSYSPFAGVKASWISYDGSYGFDRFSGDSDLVFLKKNNVDFWGVGPMVGVDANYFVVAGWSIFSAADFAVLIGESNLDHQQDFNTTVFGVDIGTKENINVFSPTMRINFGLQYEAKGYTDMQHVVLRVGFDGRYYFNQYPTVNRVTSDAPAAFSFLGDLPIIINNGSFGMMGALIELGCYF